MQKLTLTDLDLSNPDLVRNLTTARSKHDLQDYVSANFTLAPDKKHKCPRCGMIVPDAKGLIPCWHRDCPE